MIVLAIRFVLELAGVAALAFVGMTASTDPAWRAVLGVGAPLALIVVWGVVVAPGADNPLPLRVRELVGTTLLLLVAGGLAATGQPGWGTAYAAVVLVDQALLMAPGATGPARNAAAGRLSPERRI